MKVNRISIVLALAASTILLSCKAQKAIIKPKKDLVSIIDQNLKDGVAQYKLLMNNVPADSLPETFEKGKLKSISNKNWVSGFYPGTLFYLYKATGDKTIYNAGLAKLPVMEPMKNIDSHDIGFMMNDSYGIANQINPSEEYKLLVRKA
jgi:unsaturated chondroitin disaccharide hydrolase